MDFLEQFMQFYNNVPHKGIRNKLLLLTGYLSSKSPFASPFSMSAITRASGILSHSNHFTFAYTSA
jgi:hypothetical protein